jgi:16S rRNA U516 pseudouridylate synthase RsuA-like enzyme
MGLSRGRLDADSVGFLLLTKDARLRMPTIAAAHMWKRSMIMGARVLDRRTRPRFPGGCAGGTAPLHAGGAEDSCLGGGFGGGGTLCEGKFHQVKRMFRRGGKGALPESVSIGGVLLAPAGGGGFRPLTAGAVAAQAYSAGRGG